MRFALNQSISELNRLQNHPIVIIPAVAACGDIWMESEAWVESDLIGCCWPLLHKKKYIDSLKSCFMNHAMSHKYDILDYSEKP